MPKDTLSYSCVYSYTSHVMNSEWDYDYYQPWSNNEWLVEKMLALMDEDITMQ